VSINSIFTELSTAVHPATAKRTQKAAPAKDAAVLTHQAASDAELSSAGQNLPAASQRAPIIVPVINGQGIGLKFSVDKDTGTRIIQVVDVDTGEVVRQIPSEEVIAFLHQLEGRKGTLLSIKS
jgi:flagellar protein FlaG